MRKVQCSIIVLVIVGLLLSPLIFATQRTHAQGPHPDGQIVFESKRDGNSEIYVMDADGANQTRLTTHTSDDSTPAWSPNGSQIVFTSTRDGNDEIYVMDADGSNQANLTNHSDHDFFPAWSPDGTKIAFTSERDGNFEIYVMNADGSNQTNLTNHPADEYDPDWSPDGSQIIFASDRNANADIYVIDVDETNLTRLTTHPGGERYPEWSPNGSQIVFYSDRDGSGDVFLMNADGSNQTNLTNHGDADVHANWSPDGSQIIFASNRGGNFDIYVMDTDGSNITQLTTDPSIDFSPDWHVGVGSGCAADAPTEVYQGDTLTLTLDCAGITANVFGFQAGHTITAGDTLVTAQASIYTAGTVFQGQPVLEGSNTLDLYALSLQAGGTEATGDFTLGLVDYSADFPGETTFDITNLILGDINGDAIPDVQAVPSAATVAIIDVVDTLNGVVDPEGHALDTELIFALEGSPTIGTIDTTYNPDGTTSFTIHDIHGHPAHLDVDAPSHLTCREPLALSGDETDVTLPDDLILRAGDVNSDEAIDITDAAAIGLAYGNPASGELDINNDGIVNILDLIHVGRNYGTNGPTNCAG